MGVPWGKKLAYQLSPQETVSPGGGVNSDGNVYDVKKSEAVSSLNTCSRINPSLSVRLGMSKEFDTGTTPLTTVNSIGSRLGAVFHVQDGTAWKYWDTSVAVWSELVTTPNISEIVSFNSKIYGIADDTKLYEWNGTDAWVAKSGALTGAINLTVFGTKLYCVVSDIDGKLYEWNGTDAWALKGSH